MLREIRFLIEEFNTSYCNTLDSGDIEGWANYFTEDAVYKIISKENYDLNLQGGIVFADSLGMIKDRAYALVHTQYFGPRSTLHICGNVQVLNVEFKENINSITNFIYLETLVEETTKLHLAGQYHDKFVFTDGKLLLKSRIVIYDSNLINSTLIYPV